MKIIGKKVTVVKCPNCGVLLHVENKEFIEKYEYGYTNHYVDCCNCNKKIRKELNQVYGIIKLDNPGEYIQINQ